MRILTSINQINESRPIKRLRKKEQMADLRSMIYMIVQQDRPMTVQTHFFDTIRRRDGFSAGTQVNY